MPLFDVAPDPKLDLPPLRGTENQILWATQVRNGKIAHVRKLLRDEQELIARVPPEAVEKRERLRATLRRHIDASEALENEASCRFWLDHRDNTALELVDGADAKPGSDYSR